MDFTLTPGYARFDREDVLFTVNHDDVKVIEVDMVTKYCTLWTAQGGGSVDVFIDKNEDTLSFDPTATAPTILTFTFADSDEYDWHVLVDPRTRYTARIVLYRTER